MKVCSEFYRLIKLLQTEGTILHTAAAYGQIDVVKLGLHWNIPVNYTDKVIRLRDLLWPGMC